MQQILKTFGLALAFFFVTGFLITWVIREGGSFAFLHPGRWRKSPKPPPPDDPTDIGPRH